MTKAINPEREARILEAATQLFVHYGYDKTTVNEIAHAAGVSKGVIYLHFDSKDDLFEALIRHETNAYVEAWMKRIESDANGGTISSMYRNSLYALNENPFMAAMFRKDSKVLGSYLHRMGGLFKSEQVQGTRMEFVQMMQSAGAIRSDLDAKVIAHIMNILAYGLVSMQGVVDPDCIPETADLIEGIADFMDRAITPADGGNRLAGKEILRQLIDQSKKDIER
ncbi:TetR/AcrR family transcriptional regulator [Hazenella sp. IB182357]|uniref:TetR/AcrR family transcriptional regulator n=1 Tax=Polycladospora coralii TaxID=2771432 RepID=A0A926RX10_9BACL|nr:TetR/AcrR family transcriptional regulator [Polycladospora coralii]MBD1372076.1 TetR/AcrR family transcriptional regulator [Polycladospora coralii]MBS7530582.1 TetR/AcrR family transcriptional regulator [Polycladospora coralii]